MDRWGGEREPLVDPLLGTPRAIQWPAAKLHADDMTVPVLSTGNRNSRTGPVRLPTR
jgi:hypothetical protein